VWDVWLGNWMMAPSIGFETLPLSPVVGSTADRMCDVVMSAARQKKKCNQF